MFDKTKQLIGQTKTTLDEYSPEICVCVAVVSGIAGTVMACKATLEAQKIIKLRKEEIDYMNSKRPEMEEKDYKKEIAKINFNATKKIVITYLPSFSCCMLSIVGTLGVYKILTSRNVALTAAYNTVVKAYTDYRKRVIDKYGEDVDRELLTGCKKEVIETKGKNKDGSQETSKYERYSLLDKPISPYARVWCKQMTKNEYINMIKDNPQLYSDNIKKEDYYLFAGSDEFGSRTYNEEFLVAQQRNANRILLRDRWISLNDVYKLLGLPTTEAGQVVGWSLDNPDGNHYVDIGYDKSPRDFAYIKGAYLLDFNVDGQIILNNTIKKIRKI